MTKQKVIWTIAAIVVLVVIIAIVRSHKTSDPVVPAPTPCDYVCQYQKKYGHIPSNGKD